MSSSLSGLADDLAEVLHINKCKDSKSCLEYRKVKEELLIFKSLKYNKTCEKQFNKDLFKKFASTYQFCDEDINKFCLMLGKAVYPYEYMHTWERFDKTSLPDKKIFYSSLNTEDITDADYKHAERVWINFEIKNLGDYHDLYVQRDTLLLADVFENFRNKCIEIYELDPAHFLSASGLSWQASLEKTEIRLELLTDIDMLLMVEKGIRGEMCHSIHRYAEANNKYIKNYDKNKESSYIQYLKANNLYGWAMTQKPPVNEFKWEKIFPNLMKTL